MGLRGDIYTNYFAEGTEELLQPRTKLTIVNVVLIC
jgi:hypothetical protein